MLRAQVLENARIWFGLKARTVALLIGQIRESYLRGDRATAEAQAKTLLDLAALSDDRAIAALVELAGPLVQAAFSGSSEEPAVGKFSPS